MGCGTVRSSERVNLSDRGCDVSIASESRGGHVSDVAEDPLLFPSALMKMVCAGHIDMGVSPIVLLGMSLQLDGL